MWPTTAADARPVYGITQANNELCNTSCTGGNSNETSATPLPLHQWMFGIASIVGAGLISWWAWVWPKQVA